MSRRTPAAESTRDRLLRSAVTLFTARGFADVTVDEIAAGAGVTKGAFYYWFSDKSDIARDVRHVLFESLSVDALKTVDIERGILISLSEGFAQFIDALHELGRAQQFLSETWQMPADADGAMDHQAGVEVITGLIRAGQATGELGSFDAESMAAALVAACSKLSLRSLTTGDREAAVMVIQRLLASMSAQAAQVP